MTVGGRGRGHQINLRVGNPALEVKFLQQRCGQKPPHGKGWTKETKKLTYLMGKSRDVGLHSVFKG
jgi:hypothetical protein